MIALVRGLIHGVFWELLGGGRGMEGGHVCPAPSELLKMCLTDGEQRKEVLVLRGEPFPWAQKVCAFQ